MEIPDYQPFYLETLDELRAEIGRLGLDLPVVNDVSALSTPLEAGTRRIANRFCAQPVSGHDANPDGSPGALTVRRYRRYAEGGFGLIWIEATAPDTTGRAGQLRLHEETADAFRAWIKSIRESAVDRWNRDVVIVLQLAGAADAPVQFLPQQPEDSPLLSDEAIRRALEATIEAGAIAAEVGFDGVDVPSSHGALGGALLSAFDRTGPFGGSFENRTRFLLEALEGIRKRAPGLLLATRLCAFNARRHPHGFGVDRSDYRKHDLEEPLRLVGRLREAGLTLLNSTCASPNLGGPRDERAFQPHSDCDHPDEHPLTVLDRQLRIAGALREAAPGLPVVGSGFSWLRQYLPQVGAGAVGAGAIDFVGMGRSALAYPDAPAAVIEHGGMKAESSCMVCFACNYLHAAGDPVGCVIRDSGTYGATGRPTQPFDPDRLDEEARRCHFCEAAPCIAACPTHTDIPAFISAFLEGDEERAFETIRSRDLLPETTSHLSRGWLFSEGACIETALTGTPVPICDLQYTIAWRARDRGATAVRLPEGIPDKKIAIAGGGPAGVAAAARLLEVGRAIEIFEAADTLGGMPERVIPSTRFPGSVEEIDALFRPALADGHLRVHTGMTLGGNLDLAALRNAGDAVLLTTGVWQEQSLGKADGVVGALEFLEDAKHGRLSSVPDRVALLSGGDSAMDAATTAIRLGAKDLFIVYADSRATMLWHLPEEWFDTPGVNAMMHCRPLAYEVDGSGRLEGLRVHHVEPDRESVLPVDMVIEAMGLATADPLRDALAGLGLTEDGRVALAKGWRTSYDGIYAAGAVVNGGASVAQCVAEGMAAADQIHTDLGGER